MVPLNSEEGTQDIFFSTFHQRFFHMTKGIQGDQISQFKRKSVLNTHWKDWYSLEGLKLKLQYSGHLTWGTNSLEKTVMLGKVEAGGKGDERGWDGLMASLTQWAWVWASSARWWRTGKPGLLQPMGLQRVGHNWATEQQQQIKESFTVA